MKYHRFQPATVIILAHQRSGTHLVETALASHPNISTRGECFRRYLKYLRETESGSNRGDEGSFATHPITIGVDILMYNLVDIFQRHYGSIRNYKIIHLLRDPDAIAESLLQQQANLAYYGDTYLAHYPRHHTPLPHRKFDSSATRTLADSIRNQQAINTRLLSAHKALLTLHYEEITCNQEIDIFPGAIAESLLRFLDLDYCPLTTNLSKTGLWFNETSPAS